VRLLAVGASCWYTDAMLRVFSWAMFAVLMLNASVIPAAYACALQAPSMAQMQSAQAEAKPCHGEMAMAEKQSKPDCCKKGVCMVCVQAVLHIADEGAAVAPAAAMHEQPYYQLPQVAWLTLPPMRPPRMA